MSRAGETRGGGVLAMGTKITKSCVKETQGTELLRSGGDKLKKGGQKKGRDWTAQHR